MEALSYRIGKLRHLLRRRGQSREDSEDLIQEAFLRLIIYRQSKEVREQHRFLERIVANLAIDLHRKEHLDLYVAEKPEDLPIHAAGPTPDEDIAIQQRLAAVFVTLNSVSSRTREIFLMHRLDGQRCGEIAKYFGITVSAVEKHIARAVLALEEVA